MIYVHIVCVQSFVWVCICCQDSSGVASAGKGDDTHRGGAGPCSVKVKERGRDMERRWLCSAELIHL